MKKLRFILFSLLYIGHASLTAENVVLVIIDGARYTETFGDPSRTYIPRMDSLSQYGTILDHFYNDSITYTSRAVPALWCGAWTAVRDTVYNGGATQYTVKPSLFEYFRRQTGSSPENAVHVLKYVPTLWLPSFHPEYGPDYWPTTISSGSSDQDVLAQALQVMNSTHPQLLLVYLAGVDHNGHSGNWEAYTRAITTADSIVAALWQAIQLDTLYANQTTLLVTNDHGRHDDSHGGFSGHGDGCDGCRHIMFLALGPQINQGLVTSNHRTTPDFAVTAAHILGVIPEYSTGNAIEELFIPISTRPEEQNATPRVFHLYQNYPNPFNPITSIRYEISEQTQVKLAIYNLQGKKVATLVNEEQAPGVWEIHFDARPLSTGIYFYQLNTMNFIKTRKLVVLK